jgi:hypothetical protein
MIDSIPIASQNLPGEYHQPGLIGVARTLLSGLFSQCFMWPSMLLRSARLSPDAVIAAEKLARQPVILSCEPRYRSYSPPLF